MVPGLVAAGYRAVRYDARGFGRSTTEDVAFSNRADAIAVLDALGIGRAALVGNSRGGQIAIDTTIEFPDRVVALVPVGSGPGGFEAEVADEAPYIEEAERLESETPLYADAIADIDVRLWVDGPGQPPNRSRRPFARLSGGWTGLSTCPATWVASRSRSSRARTTDSPSCTARSSSSPATSTPATR
jgi:pimeloyl-ACP methyl ester carboxylesterase